MRVLFALCLMFAGSAAVAQAVDDKSSDGIDAETLSAILALAARDYPQPETAHVRSIHKSLARNGKGYCGEVSLPDGGGFTVFHAILEDGTGASVLRLVDFPETDQSSNANTVRAMMKNFGCVQ